MDLGTLLLKVLVTPASVALITWLERRFGPAVAGLVFGFPLVSSLTTAFLAAEQGPAFARDTAPGMLAGIACLAVFAATFAAAAGRAPWQVSLVLALTLYAPAALFFARTPLGLPDAILLAVLVLAAGIAAIPRPRAPMRHRPQGRWELPLRAAVATTLVVTLTAFAARLGPTATGVLLLMPVATATVSCFVHAKAGADAVRRLLRGLCWGAFSFVAFFVVVGLAMADLPTPLVLALAGAAALGAGAVAWRLGVARQSRALPSPPVQ